jgi:hypothetical protein
MKMQTATGEVNANFEVSDSDLKDADFAIILHARGGKLNPDYYRALELFLRAILLCDGSISSIEVVSAIANRLSRAERTLELRFPILVNQSTDLVDLRKKISRLQVPIAQKVGAVGGNPHKKIKIHVATDGRLNSKSFLRTILSPDAQARRRTYWATWNPGVWNDWTDFDEWVTRTTIGEQVIGRWSTGSRNHGMNEGDIIILLKQGSKKRGVIGYGTVQRRPGLGVECIYQDEHYLPKKKSKKANYVDISWTRLVDPDNRIPTDELEKEFPSANWRPQASGQLIDEGIARKILERFVDHVSHFGLDNPEFLDASDAVVESAGRKFKSKPEKRLSSIQRKAIELRAMKLARQALRDEGWKVIRDMSANNSFDFLCERPSRKLYVEVKGTTSNGQQVVLTRNEVELHRSKAPNNALIIVKGIKLSGKGRATATGGSVHKFQPWLISKNALTVIGYTYETGLSGGR